jgi:integrase
MRQIGRAEDDRRPTQMLRRLLEVRGHDARRPLSSARVRRVHATVMSALNTAVRRRKIAHNPATHVELESGRAPKPLVWTRERVGQWQRTGQRPSAVMVWTPEQTGAFLDFAAEDRLYPLWHLIAYRGLRRGETVRLPWADVDLDPAVIMIREAKSEAGERTLSLDALTVGVLRAHHEAQVEERKQWGDAWVDSGRVFTKEDGEPLNADSVSQRFDRLVARYEKIRHEHESVNQGTSEPPSPAELAARHRTSERTIHLALDSGPLPPIRLHDLRHGAATLALAAGVAMKVVSEQLGHASLQITGDIYTSVLPELAHAAAEAVARLVPRSAAVRTDVPTSCPPEDKSDGRADSRQGESAGQSQFGRWGGRDSNPRPEDYESPALTG